MCSHDDDDGDDGLVVSFFVVFDEQNRQDFLPTYIVDLLPTINVYL